ncbi:MAG: peptidoglycan DD-metalloendopeptidase family protein [Bacteroidales bacterium]|nr:peptidoglycan DD-metalloendopeptidase family protein [Bacteroidales bacterium]MDT8432035.1 peptidoglycan DD-metalloendopeptidase family protein [Bacteroidales bacterium]
MRKGWIIGGSVLLVAAAVAWIFIQNVPVSMTTVPVVSEEIPEPIEARVEYFYGVPVDSFEVVEGTVRRNQMLGNILHAYGVSAQRIYEISLIPREVFDVRKVRAGNRYAIFLDSAGVRYFAYEKDNINYAVIHLEDSIHVELREKPVIHVTEAVYGEITTSLWEAFQEQAKNPLLANELSDIYAWSIDFFGLQRGDQFKVIYNEAYVDSTSVGITKIHSAWFRHAGHEFWAIPFEQDSVVNFFDEEGNSLRKAFLKAPLKYNRVSSGFSNSRLHPVLKIRRPHHGVDYAAPRGTPVLAIGDGQVIAAAYERGGGNYVKIKHNGVYRTTYMHLQGFAKGIRQGVYVKQGDVIGYVGSTGLSTGPHLDFRFYKNGYPVDPLKVEAPPVEPVHEALLSDYVLVKNSVMAELRGVATYRLMASSAKLVQL